jgi:hypothetical protein
VGGGDGRTLRRAPGSVLRAARHLVGRHTR